MRGGPASGSLEVVRGDLDSRLLLSGELEAEEAAVLMTPNANIWPLPIRWLVEDGTEVRTGERVVEFDSSQLVGNLDEQRARVVEARNKLASTRSRAAADASEAAHEVERKRGELERARLKANIPKGLLAEVEFARRLLEMRRAELRLRASEKALEAKQAAGAADIEVQLLALRRASNEVAKVEGGIAKLTLFAPRDGIVLIATNRREDRPFQDGDSVFPGVRVASIPDLGALAVEARLFDVDDGMVEPGTAAKATLDAFPGEVFAGRVRHVDQVAQTAGRRSLRRYFKTLVDLETFAPERMLPGMSVKVELQRGLLEDVLLIPRSSLAWDLEGVRARLADGSWAGVEVGLCDLDFCHLRAGLDEGAELGRSAEVLG